MDWFYAEDDDTGAHTTITTSLVARVSITFIPDGCSDYLLIAEGNLIIDGTGTEVEMDIYDGTAPRGRHIRETKDTNDYTHLFTADLMEDPAASEITISFRGRAASGIDDHLSSRILIIRLDYYDTHSCQEVDEDVAITESFVVRATTDLTLQVILINPGG